MLTTVLTPAYANVVLCVDISCSKQATLYAALQHQQKMCAGKFKSASFGSQAVALMRRSPASLLDFHPAYSLLHHDHLWATMTVVCSYAYRKMEY